MWESKRHAGATRVDVDLKKMKEAVILSVRDNGVGITQKQIENPRSMGLLGIKERRAYFRGDVTIRGAPKKGTTISLRMPLT
ncbi:MAG: hypothetical protein KKD56_10425 [Acidobacteria bacterium]|nr:hypothetical protein [Acidobacteriota bacterium]MBU1473543.1 hypothetical protein [Acidobacteriota bacterium]MBU4331423.1 hypothetical protein [Acidobacteriota bacterium]MBU4494301.1 hypothetical protein [Acidobacteriota bacterium]MCG2817287.1 ATP-binding protein [Candidatus Aminicenantes bacterium]